MNDFIFPKVGQVVEGEVFQVKKDVILVSFGAATEGTIYARHYDKPAPDDLTKLVKTGDKIRAQVTKTSEGDDSSVILLSRLPFIQDKAYETLNTAFEQKTEVTTIVTEVSTKGLVLNFDGVEIFLPYTLLDFDLKEKKDSLVGTSLNVLIEEIKKDKKKSKYIATRKPIFEAIRAKQYEERQELRAKELDSINTGDVLEGTVESFEVHAAFIRFKQVSGMLRISQVSHHRVDKIEDALTIGQSVKVKVIKKEGNRLDLSMKALLPTPYQAYLDTHKVGQTVQGKVVSKLPFGLLVELSRDVKGLLHKNEYSWNPKDNYDAYIKIDEIIDVVILSKDPKNEKISLSKKAIEHNPWASISLRVGQSIDVRVESVTKEGVIISYDSVDGLIPFNEAHNDPKVNISDIYNVGDIVTAKVIEFSKENWILKLSVRRLLEASERAEFEKYLSKESDSEGFTLGDMLDLKNNKK